MNVMPFSLAASASQFAGAVTCVPPPPPPPLPPLPPPPPPPHFSSLGLAAQNCFLHAAVPSASLVEQSGFSATTVVPPPPLVHFCDETAAAALAPPFSRASLTSLSISEHLLLRFSA